MEESRIWCWLDAITESIRFEKDESGNVTVLTLHQNGAEMEAPK
jgi:hypothetical protein